MIEPEIGTVVAGTLNLSRALKKYTDHLAFNNS
jgi:hypothetical protein